MVLYNRKYEPKSWDDWLGNPDVRELFKHKTVDELLNYAFVGPPGIGKSLAGKLLAKTHFKNNYQEWNMSLKRRISDVETSIIDFCKSGTKDGLPMKLALFSEADGISLAAQKALRVPMEKFAHRIIVIITGNYSSKIIDALHSRGCTVRFKLGSLEDLRIFINRIIDGEKLEITESQINGILRDSRGKFRNVANILQGWTAGRKVYYKDKGDLILSIDKMFDCLVKLDQDKMLDTCEDILLEYESNDIIFELMRRVREDELPRRLKSMLLIACGECADKLTRIDPYIAFWQLSGKMVEILKGLRRKK